MKKNSRLIRIRFFFAILILALSINNSMAQGLQLLLDPINPFQQQSLFSLSLINQSNFNRSVTLTATLKSRKGKLLLIQETTQQVESNATVSVRGGDVHPTIRFIDANFEEQYNGSQQLPAMNYVLCVEAITLEKQGVRVQECIDYQASDFVNIYAVYPPELGEIYDARPNFTWVNLNENGCSYDYRLVKIADGQNPNAAVRRNTPIVALDGITQNQIQYPADASVLENNQDYAWQLTLNCNGERIAKSDAFVFTYNDQEQYVDIPRNLAYVDITEVENGANLYAVGEFKWSYPSEERSSIIAELYEIKANKPAKTKRPINLTEYKFEVGLGINRFELDLNNQVQLKHLKKYQLLLKDKRTGKTHSLVIQYVNPDYIKSKDWE